MPLAVCWTKMGWFECLMWLVQISDSKISIQAALFRFPLSIGEFPIEFIGELKCYSSRVTKSDAALEGLVLAAIVIMQSLDHYLLQMLLSALLFLCRGRQSKPFNRQLKTDCGVVVPGGLPGCLPLDGEAEERG